MFTFPDPVNEVAARLVAAGVALVAFTAVVTGQAWLALPLAYGFVARVLAGPRLSPWALVVTKLVVPRLPVAERPVAGPPKRFAQGIGAVLTSTAVVCWSLLGWSGAALGLLAMVAVAATLEAALGFCLGCKIFGLLVRNGLLPDAVCESCADLGMRPLNQL